VERVKPPTGGSFSPIPCISNGAGLWGANQNLESMKYILKFYEVADSDYSYISLEVDGVVVGRNYDPLTHEGTMWLNQTLEGEATKGVLESLKRILKLN
jgi:hypothetical protein